MQAFLNEYERPQRAAQPTEYETSEALREIAGHTATIKVVGVGGGGCNAVDRMIAEGVQGVEFITVNTDAQALRHSRARSQVQIGLNLTRGLGSGGKPTTGQGAAEESQNEIAAHLKGADMVFITAGMGGGTGTGAAPVIAGIAQDQGALTVGVVSKPFAFEGNHRRKVAEQGIEQLRPLVDTLIVVPNERLIQIVVRHTPMLQAFRMADRVLLHGIQGITDMITRPGLINVDFADVSAIMSCAGTAWMAVGQGSGNNRVLDAVNEALTSPLLETSIHGAKGVLCNIVGGEDMALGEMSDGIDIVAETVDSEANIIFGAMPDASITNGSVKVTLIATGFDVSKPHIQRAAAPRLPERQPPPEREQAAPAAQESTTKGRGRLQRIAPRPAQPAPEKPPEAQPAPAPLRAAVASSSSDADLDIPPFLRNRLARRGSSGQRKT
jgi:cell division protein FtsZ